MQAYGRKFVYIGLQCFAFIGFVIVALANSVNWLFAARTLQGIPMCIIIVSTVILGEYSNPKRRGYFISISKSSFVIGSLLCHCFAISWNWKHIATAGAVSHAITLFLTFLWPESPSFLALTGKYAECEKSHKWLFGDTPKSKRLLDDLLSTQMEYKERVKRKRNLKTLLRCFLKKDFMKPFIISSLLMILTNASGRMYMPAYVIEILKGLTKDESMTAYCTIGSDILTLIAFLSSSFVIRYWRRRTLLFISGITCVILMGMISLLTVLKSRYNFGISVYWWLSPLIILSIVFVANMGIIPTCYAIMGEIFPLEHKGIGTSGTGIIFTVLYALSMKCTPIMMERTGVEGTFGIYALLILVCSSILYFILNETKDKTLQEIERDIKGVKHPDFDEYYLKENPLIEPS